MKANSKFYTLFLITTLLTMLGCKKELKISESNNPYFQRAFSLGLNQKCYSISQTDDNGFLLIGSQDGFTFNDQNSIAIIKTDSYGNLEWSKTIDADTFLVPCISKQKDGSFLIAPTSEGRYLYKLDKNGNQIFKSSFNARNPYIDFYSYPTQKSNGEIVFASSNQVDNNTLGDFIIFDKQGQFSRLIPINKNSLNPADHVCVYKVEDTSTYYYYGIERFYLPIPKIFIGKQSNYTFKKKLIVDSENISDANLTVDVELRHLLLEDGRVILYNTPMEASGNYKGYIALIDNDLNKVWEKNLRIGTNGTSINNMSLCADGNYLISGSCKTNNNLLTQPFACKIDANGKIIWQKIFTTKYSGSFICGIQLADGSYVFGGTTNGYGGGQSFNDMFILKTDKDGNLNPN